ncbi:MAG: hypothetical protein CME28_09275 [Gemmatimonadetes bacterium]|nr:hypothetical protein [Gemmatimonadota bacterium]
MEKVDSAVTKVGTADLALGTQICLHRICDRAIVPQLSMVTQALPNRYKREKIRYLLQKIWERQMGLYHRLATQYKTA